MIVTLPRGLKKIRIALAGDRDRDVIYRLRHTVYARELGQHPENTEGKLSDALDNFNIYIVAYFELEIAGFISITSPGSPTYSVDKYLSRNDLPFSLDHKVFEVRLLTVVKPYRGREIASLLMYAAFRWAEAHGGERILVLGRGEILDLYMKVGLQPLGRQTRSGAVTFELMSATTRMLHQRLTQYAPILRKYEGRINWQLGIPFHTPAACFHGGAFFDAVGDEFDALDKRKEIINAEVLDAWFPPSPKVLSALRNHLSWIARTSPPTSCEGMIRTIARVRGVDSACIIAGAGSSDLIFLALREWLSPSSRVLILDPMYGEYAHVLERVVGCHVDRLRLSRSNGYLLEPTDLEAPFDTRYDMVILVNPNSPTGRHVAREELEKALKRAPVETRVWVDETYVEYVGQDQSLEHFATQSENVIVCKSMSKVYALSGVRAAYLCAPPHLAEELRAITPPWAVSLPGQVAAVMALRDPGYYAERYKETHALRSQLVKQLLTLGKIEIVPSVANFLLCHLSPDGPDAATVIHSCRAYGLFLRNAATMGSQLGAHALRIAVKDAETNRRIVEILRKVLHARKRGRTGIGAHPTDTVKLLRAIENQE